MIRCMIVDDEPIAIRVVSTHLEMVPDAEVVATCTNAAEALRVLRKTAVDLLFLDVEMPELTGIDLVESLADPPAVIFTTAHRHYAVRGFDLDAVDYLLKPISFPRLNRAVEKFRRTSSLSGEARDAIPDAVEPLHVQVDRRTVRLDPHKIRFIESLSDYVIIHTDDEKLTVKSKISDLEERLLPAGFLRIHRSYLVPLNRIDAYSAARVEIGEHTLPVSRTYRQRVARALEAGKARRRH